MLLHVRSSLVVEIFKYQEKLEHSYGGYWLEISSFWFDFDQQLRSTFFLRTDFYVGILWAGLVLFGSRNCIPEYSIDIFNEFIGGFKISPRVISESASCAVLDVSLLGIVNMFADYFYLQTSRASHALNL